MDLDLQMARMRKEFDWEGQINLSIDPDRTRAWLEKSESAKEEGCTMCGELCAIKLGKEKTHRMF
jgi:phosphomethylpyrimidine synthase